MKRDELKAWILTMVQDINFIYVGVEGSICPFNEKDIAVAYGDECYEFNDIEDVMKAPIFQGKSLNEISEQLNIN